jgi:hypothetical protein
VRKFVPLCHACAASSVFSAFCARVLALPLAAQGAELGKKSEPGGVASAGAGSCHCVSDKNDLESAIPLGLLTPFIAIRVMDFDFRILVIAT